MRLSSAYTCLRTLIICAILAFCGPSVSADTGTAPDEIQLTIKKVPVDIWKKDRIILMLIDNQLVMRDTGPGPLDDASYWEVEFETPLPYGRKEFVVDIVVDASHKPLWNGQLLQPIINGKEAVPALDDSGAATTELLISDYDGKAFIPTESGTYSFQMPASEEQISSFAFMTAGAENFYLMMSNFRVRVWPDVDERVWPQRPQVSTLGYQSDKPVTVFVDWHNDLATKHQTSLDLTLTGPSETEIVPVMLPRSASALSGGRVSRVNLGKLPAGRYTLEVPAIGERTSAATAHFEVTENMSTLRSARDQAWNAFYWITAGDHGPYPDAHPQDATANVFGAPDTTIDISGGWYDAGDYGKYTVNGAYAVSMMMLTGLNASTALDHPIDTVANAPADVPDWLRVVDVQLDWLLKMQCADGAVYHKAATQKWPSMSTAPEDDTETKWVMPVSSTATADFAGAMALAAAVYGRQSDPAYSARAAEFLSAAERALDWLDANPAPMLPEVTYNGERYGGPYEDTDDADERFFANAAYATATGDRARLDRAAIALSERIDVLKANEFALNWQNVDMLGLWALAASHNISAETKNQLHDALRATAYQQSVLQNRSAWNLSIKDGAQLAWGSNSVFATAIWHWLMWAQLSGETRYVDAAETQIHYFFGQNPLGRTYITGSYTNAVAAPHFRPWSSGRIDLPAGLIVGGPNSTDLGGDPLTGALSVRAPLRMHADDVASFATNEVAINWQATWALSASLLIAAKSPAY